jgi:hypothetical protein
MSGALRLVLASAVALLAASRLEMSQSRRGSTSWAHGKRT